MITFIQFLKCQVEILIFSVDTSPMFKLLPLIDQSIKISIFNEGRNIEEENK